MGLRSLAVLSLLFSSKLVTANADVDTYDYIVVGSGPGGGPLASNLARSGATVLLLEAGDDQSKNLNLTVGGLFNQAGNDDKMRWDFFIKYHTDPSLDAKYDHLTWRMPDGQFYVGLNPPAGAKQLGVYYPRAGTLGGCSTHNAMCSAVPSQADWQFIANLTGDSSWSPDNMTRHFMDLENDHVVPPGTKGHGFSGFLDISVNGPEYLRNQSDAQTILAATAKKLGQATTDVFAMVQRDLNNNDADHDQQTGVFGFPAHRDPMGRRVHAGTAVLQTLNATNADGSKKYPLTLSTESLATKILFNTTGSAKPKAIGIEYFQGQSMYKADPRYNASNPGMKKQAFARKEVIISGGTFNTPQLLKLSGVGPKAELAKFNISVVVDLPGVGTNLQDNPEIGSIATANKPALANLGPICTWGAPGDPCLDAWYQGKGMYAQGPLNAIMVKTSNATERDLFIFGIPSTSFRGYWPALTVNTITPDPPSTWDFSIVKIHPQSRMGTVTLNSADPRDTPEINFRFFEGPGSDADIAAMAEGMQLGRSIFDSIPAPLGPFTETFPCADRKCDLKEKVLTQSWSHHASSSCAIGADSDPMAVLDSKFRVRGTSGLRVVDASAFPRVPGGFPVIPTFMISMKASEDILRDAKAM